MAQGLQTVTIAAGVGSIRSDARGFSRLGALYRQLKDIRDSQIRVDLSQVDWFDGHMAAPMNVVVRKIAAQGNKVAFTRPKPDVETVLRKNGFLPEAIPDFHKTTMPLTEFALTQGVDFSLYAKRHLARREMPKMSLSLRGKFFEGIDELFANSALHSKSSFGITVGGQFFPKSDRIDFTISDGGVGIPGAVRQSRLKPTENSDPGLIHWAMQDNNTTRQGDIPGGLGSRILRDFVRLNRGKLIIASNGGFWRQSGEEVEVLRLGNAFPGTAVLLEVNTGDRNRYDFRPAPDPNSIW